MKYKTISSFREEYYGREENNLDRFIVAQNQKNGDKTTYEVALSEIQEGKKQGHWMWFIFPQLRGLGKSWNSNFYGLDNLTDARRYVENHLLCSRLCAISNALSALKTCDPISVFGYTDTKKLHSSMTLFKDTYYMSEIATFVLKKYFKGIEDERTKRMMHYVNINELAVDIRALIDPFDDFSRRRFSEKFPNAQSPRIEPTKENLFASEEFYIEKAKEWCVKNNIGYFFR